MRRTVVVLVFLVPVLACSAAPDLANWTDAEQAAWASPENRGALVLTVRDAETGAPVTDCDYHSARFAFERRLVEPHPPMMIDGPARPGSAAGRYRWDLAAGWHQLRVDANGYRNAWTPVFRIQAGKETALDLAMRTANRLKVVLLDENGAPVADGGVLLTGKDYRGGMHIADGVGERLIPADEITVTVGDVFMEDYARETVTVPLRPGIVNEVTIRLRR